MQHRILLALGLAAVAGPAFAENNSPVATGPEFASARQPQVAVAPSGRIHVTFGVGNAIYCATSTDAAKSFDPPVKVAEHGVLALGKRRGPRIAATNGSLVVAAVCGQRGGGKDGDLLAWRSADGGKTWAEPVTVNRVTGSAREGLHDLTAGPDRQLFCVWLDLRNGKSQVFGSLSTDGGATWGEDRRVYDSPTGAVCPCCQPSACFDASGRIHVLFRNNINDDRDMFVTTTGDRGNSWTTQKLGKGTWHLKACPMDGGGLAADVDGNVHTIWRRNQTIFRCADGRPEVSLGPGEQGRAALGRNGVYLTWVSQRPGTLLVLPPNAEKPLRLAEQAADPAIATRPDSQGPVVVVWEEAGAAGGPIRARVIAP
jgi:BNR repeat-like domain